MSPPIPRGSANPGSTAPEEAWPSADLRPLANSLFPLGSTAGMRVGSGLPCMLGEDTVG